MQRSVRSDIITRKTYSRKKSDGKFETIEEILERVIQHQEWLWERALKRSLNTKEFQELHILKNLMLENKISSSGRSLWLGGTKTSRDREGSLFSCAFTEVFTISDVVDVYWSLLQGCGPGFKPRVGMLSGFSKVIQKIECIPSIMTEETYISSQKHNGGGLSSDGKTFLLVVGDSAEAWSKAVGKLLAMKHRVEKLILNFSQIRPEGVVLKGYGWVSSGYKPLQKALLRICDILNRRANELLSVIDILDIINLLGTTLSSRRSAEMAICDYKSKDWEEFARAKTYAATVETLNHRMMSNNSLLFWSRPSQEELEYVFDIIEGSGGSEPGIINGEAALKRAPWFSGTNPCGETLLSNKSFCNLTELNLKAFNGLPREELFEAIYYLARSNYRQTCVNLRDGILQDAWHEVNSFLRLCGVGLTGIVQWNGLYENDVQEVVSKLREEAHRGANSMADELNLPRSKAITTIKPSGTQAKRLNCSEGIHAPIGRYIFNSVVFRKYDPLVSNLVSAGYKHKLHPTDKGSVLVVIPTEFPGGKYSIINDVEVTDETAIDQLNRYLFFMKNYVDHNCSITVYYKQKEIPEIIQWLQCHWQDYVAVSFLPWSSSIDPCGYPYLPQQAVSKEEYMNYVSQLKEVNFDERDGSYLTEENDCVIGACPIR